MQIEDVIAGIQAAIARLMQECANDGIADLYPIAVRHGAFWGMCTTAARLEDRRFGPGDFHGVFGDDCQQNRELQDICV